MPFEPLRIPSFLAGLFVAFTGACFVDFPDVQSGDVICDPGGNVFCRCPGGAPGTRACNEVGTAFGECVVAAGESCPTGLPDDDDAGSTSSATGQSSSSGSKGMPMGGAGGAAGAGGDGGAAQSNCGTIDFIGQCMGDDLAYCSNGTLIERDCSDDGKICALVDDTIGYDCLEPPDPCMGVTLQGECVGETLRWCSTNMVVEIDCAAQNLSCGYNGTSELFDCIETPPT